MVKIVVLVDDKSFDQRLKVAHGLSLYLEFNDIYLLFDLGPNSEILQYNVEKLGIDVELVDATIISHIHSTHIGGLSYIGWVSPYLKVYIPYDSMHSLGRMARSNGLIPEEVIDWINPWPGIYISKPIHGPPWEHFLVIDTSRGLIVFSGCMHPGVDKVLDIITGYLDRNIYGVVGGFHLENAPRSIIDKTIHVLFEKYCVEKIAPLHCSGELFKRVINENYPDRIIEAGAGSILDIG
ncbi:MAG: MBL fold metallo-hydrolase [Desulfurococcales archaeon ex4484_58]|nr:MAG: MBL fold metallo-hydrolase [Desulfurococcales archaeon ex4484_58]